MITAADITARILPLFVERGFRRVDPPIVQPADVFIEKSGEAIRAHTFLFTDPDGVAELCLRPDLTVPTCRWHLQHAADPATEAKYCYAGPVFRYHAAADPLTPREYGQVGVEWFAAPDAIAADAEVLALAVRAVREAAQADALTSLPLSITIGDIGLIRALLADIDMPPRWRARLLRNLRRPIAFRRALHELAYPDSRVAKTSISPLVDELAKQPTMQRALELAERELQARNLELVGGRTLEDIATRLLEKAENRHLPPLKEEHLHLIYRLQAIKSNLAVAVGEVELLAQEAGENMRFASKDFFMRANKLQSLLPAEYQEMTFDAKFGQKFGYYTGFIFSVYINKTYVAGGGRYDDMLASLGGPDVSALGMALNMPRLLSALQQWEAA